ncbi:MAG: hypothetical protein JO276_08025 [Sphingomonadaceae bacterium]|nr:hypothetical protein [Sphingomonadaceae bacterium]
MILNPILALALAAQAAPEPIAMTPTQFAAAIQGVVGQTYQGGVRIARIYAEGQILVIVLDGPAGWRSMRSTAEVSSQFLTGFCEDRDFEYFVNGNLMRVDTTEGGGAARPGPVIRTCPPPPTGAHPQ